MNTIKKMYDHLSCANQRILEALRNTDNEEARRLFAHILCAEKVWIARLQEKDSSQLPIWTDMTLTECKDLADKNEMKLTNYLASLTNAEMNNEISYKNSKGNEFKTSICDILTHLALHGQYHRGQVNIQFRLNDIEPVNVDYITFVR